MCSIKIDCNTLKKLTHDSIEIRLRTLNQLAAKVSRALEFEGNIEFKPGDLCKQLIRWFGFRPLQEPLKVLKLLKSIIESPKYGSKAINKLGSVRLIKELNKIQTFFESQSVELGIINEIINFLKTYTNCQEKSSNCKKSENIDNITQCASNVKTSDEAHEFFKEDRETPCPRPSAADYRSMKFLSDILISKFTTSIEIENAVLHLQLAMKDYPAEYLLQAPHIFRNLLHIFDVRKSLENHRIYFESIAAALFQFLSILEKRIKMVSKSSALNKAFIQTDLETICQLKIEKALTELFDASICHLEMHASRNICTPVLWDIIFTVVYILKNMEKHLDVNCLYKISSIVANLSLKIEETEHCTKLRLHQILLMLLLQEVVRLNICPNTIKALEVVEPILRDFTMKNLFEERHQLVEAYVFKACKSQEEKYKLLKLYEISFEMSIQMLKNKSNLACGVVIEDGLLACTVLDMLKSKTLIDILFRGVIEGISLYPKNNQLKTQAVNLLIKLLNINFKPIKIYIYEKLTNAFKRNIGCLMTGERYTLEYSNADLLKANVIGVPLSTELLMQLVHGCFESSCDQIQSNCCKIFELLLKSKNLFEANWYSLVQALEPSLPLLNCCTFSQKIMNVLLKLYDPDLRELPYICVLKGNIGFLFHGNAERRTEALTRLIYMLNTLEGKENYLPCLTELSDTLPNDICLQNTPLDYQNIFSDRSPVRGDVISSLNNLLYLLESPDVEPLIRKTTLMQINVLCCNWHVTAELCNVGACYLIMQALENALQKSSDVDYADAALPAISILNKIMLYDSSVRCELANTVNIYVLLLRAVIMFQHDIQIRQDVSMCLFQLLFTTQLVSTDTGIEGPLILDNIKLPVNINLCSALNNKLRSEPEKLSQMFASQLEETKYWRMVIASTYCGGLKNITQKSTNVLSKLDISEDLILNSQDVRIILATQPSVSLHHLLKAALNATDHSSLSQACQLLKQQLIVLALKYTFDIDDNFCLEMNSILRKYLQMSPGNANDLEVYEHLLDVANACIKIPLKLVALEIFKCLHKDPNHSLVTMLTLEEKIPLRVFIKIASFLRYVIDKHKHLFHKHFQASECSCLYRNLFETFIARSLELFDMRDLQRVRCLLSVLVVISSCQLEMSDQLLFFYCRRFAQLSLALKSFTQTGSQWHRDCLLAILQLSEQMQNRSENFRLAAGFIKYLSGLCGHNDMEVRTFAWSILNVTAKTKAIDSSDTEQRKSCDISGTEMLINELSYLPGGFMACCLSTMLDNEEAISVRHLAGQLLAVLIRTQSKAKDIEKLLQQHNFTRFATEALAESVLILELEIPMELDTSTINILNCDLISCYTLVFIEMSQRLPSFLNELCTKSFMFKLYEILKQPPPPSKHAGYLYMIGHICHLYTLCSINNIIFLQRTICHDDVWLRSFCHILFGIAASSNEVYVTFNMLQLLLVLIKDSSALEQLVVKLQSYATDIVKFYQAALNINNLKTTLQSCSLSVLSLLLIKSQADIDVDIRIHILALLESLNVSIKSVRQNAIMENDIKENNGDKKEQNNYFGKDSVVDMETSKSSISEHLCVALIQLFLHLYPATVCKFSAAPKLHQQHVTETLALLLKQSLAAQETAENLKFQEKVLKIFKVFFEEFATTSCTTYIKRNGELKKLAVIKNLLLLFKLLICWHSSPSMIITDNILAMDYSKIIIQIWPWLAHSSDLKLSVLQVCSFLSERSFVICKQFSTLNNISYPHSVLQLVAKMVTADTLKIKANSSNCGALITAGLRVLMNCCSCLEGRTALNKIRALDVFDSLHPFNPKASQTKLNIVIAWLEFWELFSRYDEGARLHHLSALCSVTNKSLPGCPKRLISLRILRNMAFLNCNRSGLITSNDFIFTINAIISQPIKDSVEEQFIICVALWKIISGGIKFVAIIRGTKLAKNLRLLMENLTCAKDENEDTIQFANDLLNVLNIIFKIFNN